MDVALLLAEPEPGIRSYLERQLASDGFQVTAACFNGEALELAERSRPDLVLLSELDLCSRLRAGEPGRCWNRDVPVIVVGPSGAADLTEALQGRSGRLVAPSSHVSGGHFPTDRVLVRLRLMRPLFCIECGATSTSCALGWRAYLVDLDDDGEDEVAFYCPACARREFGPAKRDRAKKLRPDL